MKISKYTGLGLLSAALLLAGCGGSDEQSGVKSADKSAAETVMAGGPTKGKAEDIGNRGEVVMALQNKDRPQADRDDDAVRKSEHVLQFVGIWPGMTVVELEAGGGYYTEIMSRILGDKGKLYVQNPPAFDAFFKPEEIIARYGENGERLPNVTKVRANFDDLSMVPSGSADIVTWFLGPHELFYTPRGAAEGLGDPEKSYAEIARVLKPGGAFFALDHAAASGAPESTGGDTHRIDPAAVRKRAEAAGLVFAGESKVLRNPDDDYDVGVFDPAVRRKTDRFLHKYVKPQ